MNQILPYFSILFVDSLLCISKKHLIWSNLFYFRSKTKRTKEFGVFLKKRTCMITSNYKSVSISSSSHTETPHYYKNNTYQTLNFLGSKVKSYSFYHSIYTSHGRNYQSKSKSYKAPIPTVSYNRPRLLKLTSANICMGKSIRIKARNLSSNP